MSASLGSLAADGTLGIMIPPSVNITSVLAVRDVFRRTGAARIGLVTPYLSDVRERIAPNWEAVGFTVAAERHTGLQDDFSFAEAKEATIAELARAVAVKGCDAMAVVCTNMRGASLVEPLGRELGMPVSDFIATALWAFLRVAGVPHEAVEGCGSLFRDLPSSSPRPAQSRRSGDRRRARGAAGKAWTRLRPRCFRNAVARSHGRHRSPC